MTFYLSGHVADINTWCDRPG